MKWWDYDYYATSKKGFVQQVACGWVRNGYVFYVQGVVPEGKNPWLVDQKFFRLYPIAMKASRRHSRKKRRVLNVAYLRHQEDYLMLATHGRHEETRECWLDWRQTEAGSIRDCSRGQPIKIYGYSIYYVRGGYVLNRNKLNPDGPPERDYESHVRVQLSRRTMANLRKFFLENATRKDEAWFRSEFWNLPFEPYAPVRRQLLTLLNQINGARKRAWLSPIPTDAIRFRRKPVRVFR